MSEIRVGAILRDGLSHYRRHFVSFFGIALLMHLPVIAWTVAAYLGALPDSIAVDVASVVLMTLSAALTAMVVVHMVATSATLGRSLRAVAPRTHELLALQLLVALIVFAGFVAIVIPGILFAMRTAVAVPVMIAEGAGIKESIRRSWALTMDHGSAIFRLLFVLALVDGLPSVVLELTIDPNGPLRLVLFVVPLVLSLLVEPLRASTAAVVYREVSESRNFD